MLLSIGHPDFLHRKEDHDKRSIRNKTFNPEKYGRMVCPDFSTE
jgi:hypothetical protein